MKKMNFKLLLLGALVAITFSSCSKKSDDPAPSSTNSSGANVSGSYFPSTTNSTWSFDGGNGPYTATVTGKEKVIGGSTYRELSSVYESNSSSPVLSYVRKDGNKYYSSNDLGTFNLKMIDLDLPVGTTWNFIYPANQYSNAVYTSKVTGVNLTRTVNSVNYTNVISVEMLTTSEYSASYIATLKSGGVPQNVIDQMVAQLAASKISQTTYYALNVGLIEQVSADYPQLAVNLKSSSIK